MRYSVVLVVRFDADCLVLYYKQTFFGFVKRTDKKKKQKKNNGKKTSEKKNVFFTSLGKHHVNLSNFRCEPLSRLSNLEVGMYDPTFKSIWSRYLGNLFNVTSVVIEVQLAHYDKMINSSCIFWFSFF